MKILINEKAFSLKGCTIIDNNFQTFLKTDNVLFTLNCTTHSSKTLLCVVQFNMNKTLYVISNSTRKIF